MQRSGVKLYHIPYKSAPNAVQDLAAGEVQAMFVDVGTSGPWVRSGRLRALAVSSESRLAAIPEVPTFAELGMPNFDPSPWVAVAVPARTVPSVVERLAGGLQQAMHDPAVVKKVNDMGMEVFFTSGSQASDFATRQIDGLGNLVKGMNLKLN